jgi:CheY-like chemotaxis protein
MRRREFIALVGGTPAKSKTFGSAQEFLASLPDGLPECLIVDLQMPDMTGLELHHHLTRWYPNSDHHHYRTRRYQNTGTRRIRWRHRLSFETLAKRIADFRYR